MAIEQQIIGSLCRFKFDEKNDVILTSIVSSDNDFFINKQEKNKSVALIEINGNVKNKIYSIVDEVKDYGLIVTTLSIPYHDAPPKKYYIIGFTYDIPLPEEVWVNVDLSENYKKVVGLLFFNQSDISFHNSADILNNIDLKQIDFFTIIKNLGFKSLLTIIMIMVFFDVYIVMPIKETVIKNKDTLIEKIFLE